VSDPIVSGDVPIWYGPDLVRDAGLAPVSSEARQVVFTAYDSVLPWSWLFAGPECRHVGVTTRECECGPGSGPALGVREDPED